jgi:hypothetical protein
LATKGWTASSNDPAETGSIASASAEIATMPRVIRRMDNGRVMEEIAWEYPVQAGWGFASRRIAGRAGLHFTTSKCTLETPFSRHGETGGDSKLNQQIESQSGERQRPDGTGADVRIEQAVGGLGTD